MARRGNGKPCGASHISNSKTCRVNLPSAIGKALNAATGEIGAASLKKAVRKYAGEKGVERLREIRADIRGEMGGNIVKGPKADEMKKRLQEEGLLPKRKPDSAEPPQSGLRKELKEIAAKDPQAVTPKRKAEESADPAMVPFATNHLKKQLEKGKKLVAENPEGPNRKNQEAALARIEKEVAKRAAKPERLIDVNPNLAKAPKAGELTQAMDAFKAKIVAAMKPVEPVSARPDSLYGAWKTDELRKHRDFLAERGGGERNLKKADAELKRRGAEAAAKPDSKPDSRYGRWGKAILQEHLSMLKGMGDKTGQPGVIHQMEIDRIERELLKRTGVKKTEKTEPITKVSANTKWAKINAKDFDSTFTPADRQGGTYDWNETSKSGTKKLGEGSFGVVLLAKGPPPVAVKRGEVSSKEALIIEKVGKAGLGPNLIAGETAKGGTVEHGVKLKQGRIAMTVVPGKELGNRASDTKIGNTTTGDAYWKARADLHRLGVAHNDTHIRNLMIDETGKGRWVDLGLAHDHPGAALAEALGVLRKPVGSVGGSSGDWQGTRWERETGNREGQVLPNAPSNLKRMERNHKTRVLPFLRGKNLTDDEIANVMTIGIRQPPTDYITKAGFNKLNDSDALQAINLLYDGI